ncbi:MAG TPA: hypothetical protein VGO07_02700 [Candidatus Saccharimonadales bacterium]|jgi:hypothetical protein|nr:hypothetical protein [Candidatus Saccharimonadales bacterium]
MTPRQKLAIVVVAVIVLVITVVLLVIPPIQHRGKLAVHVFVLPKDSTLTLDGKKVRDGTVYMSSGKHTLKASRQYFDSVSKDIDTAKIDLKQPIYMMPRPTSKLALDWLGNHPDEQQKREAAASFEVDKQQSELAKNPLIDKLPYTAAGIEYIIDYDAETASDGSVTVTIIIKANTSDAQNSALQWIRDQGVDPNTLRISFQSNGQQDDPSVGHQ